MTDPDRAAASADKLCPAGLIQQARQLLLTFAQQAVYNDDKRDAQKVADALYAVLYDPYSYLPEHVAEEFEQRLVGTQR